MSEYALRNVSEYEPRLKEAHTISLDMLAELILCDEMLEAVSSGNSALLGQAVNEITRNVFNCPEQGLHTQQSITWLSECLVAVEAGLVPNS